MLPLPNPVYKTKCTATLGQMPHPSPKPSPKHKPWTALAQPAHRVDLILPEDVFLSLDESLASISPPVHWRVTAGLGSLLEGLFFLDYVKTGKVMVLSEGIEGVDNVFSIRDGVLSMFLGKESYERAGLVGKPDGAKANRAGKPRWIVQYDLKAPSMVAGKKGFDRLLYACRTVFSNPLTWLYTYTEEPPLDPLQSLHPIKFTARYTPSPTLNANTPPLTLTDLASSRPSFEETATELYEWLSLVRLSSPRVEAGDEIDPYLSTYRVPAPVPTRLRRVSWRGFIPAAWVRDALARVLSEVPSKSWLSLSATSSRNEECTFFRPPDSVGQYLLWEIRRD